MDRTRVFGATKLNITTLSIMTLSIRLETTLNDAGHGKQMKHSAKLHSMVSGIMPSDVMLSIVY